MKTINIAVCDDDRVILSTVSGIVKTAFTGHGLDAEIECFPDAARLKKRMDTMCFDLILLDIDMPGQDGIELGKELRGRQECPEIIYVTSREDRVFDSFAVHPFGFVRKSRFLQDIGDVIALYVKLFASCDSDKSLIIQTHDSKLRVRFNEILYFEGNRCYQNLYLRNSKEPVEFRSTMERLEEDLGEQGFFRIHKGYLINLRYIRRIDAGTVTLINGTCLPVSRRKAAELKNRFLSFGRMGGMPVY